MPNNGYFSVKRDKAIIHSGGFQCHACLTAKPSKDQSPDPRYCQGCYDFFHKEAERDTGQGESRRKSRTNSTTSPSALTLESGCNKTTDHRNHRLGRPRADVPFQKVLEMKSQGAGLRHIARGLGVSHMTISRLLKTHGMSPRKVVETRTRKR